MKETYSDFRKAILSMSYDTESLDDIEDMTMRHQLIDRAQRDTISIPGLKPGIEDKIKIAPVGTGSSKGSGKNRRFGKKKFLCKPSLF